jgi:hypothetical protein
MTTIKNNYFFNCVNHGNYVNCGSDKKIPKSPFQPELFHDLINFVIDGFLEKSM